MTTYRFSTFTLKINKNTYGLSLSRVIFFFTLSKKSKVKIKNWQGNLLKSKDLFYDNCLSFMAWGIITANTFRFNHMFLFQEQKTKIITKNRTVVKIKIWTHMAKYALSNLCAGISLSSTNSLKWRQFILIIRVETLWARGKMCGKQEKINSKRRCYSFRQEFADKCSLDHRLWWIINWEVLISSLKKTVRISTTALN